MRAISDRQGPLMLETRTVNICLIIAVVALFVCYPACTVLRDRSLNYAGHRGAVVTFLWAHSTLLVLLGVAHVIISWVWNAHALQAPVGTGSARDYCNWLLELLVICGYAMSVRVSSYGTLEGVSCISFIIVPFGLAIHSLRFGRAILAEIEHLEFFFAKSSAAAHAANGTWACLPLDGHMPPCGYAGLSQLLELLLLAMSMLAAISALLLMPLSAMIYARSASIIAGRGHLAYRPSCYDRLVLAVNSMGGCCAHLACCAAKGPPSAYCFKGLIQFFFVTLVCAPLLLLTPEPGSKLLPRRLWA